jgi:hypothetical protein
MKFVKSIFGGKSTGEKNAIIAQNKIQQDNLAAQQSAAAQQIQAQGQDQARIDRSLAGARKSNRGRRLLMDGGEGKATLG